MRMHITLQSLLAADINNGKRAMPLDCVEQGDNADKDIDKSQRFAP